MSHPSTEGWPLAKYLLFKMYQLIFANRLLTWLAKLRVKHGFYRFPLDAYFVIQGERLKSWYRRLVFKAPGEFSYYED